MNNDDWLDLALHHINEAVSALNGALAALDRLERDELAYPLHLMSQLSEAKYKASWVGTVIKRELR